MFTAGQSSCDAPPESPIDLAASLAGGAVTLTWGASSSSVVSGYRIEAGLQPGERSFAATVGPDSQTFNASAPGGVFYIRVVTLSACGESAASNEVIIGVGDALMPPGAPGTPAATIGPGAVTVQWTAPTVGGSVTGYLLEAGSGPGLNDLGNIALSSTIVNFANVPPGTYYVRVRAVNGAGAGPPSDEVVIVVP
jgi:predicted phage tail protein